MKTLLKRTLAAIIVLSLYAVSIVSWSLFQAFLSCDQQGNEKRVTISQGVSGTVCFWEGNFMPIMQPSYGIAREILDFLDVFDILRVKPHHGTNRAVVREIYACRMEQALIKQLMRSNSFSVIPATVVATTSSDKKGFYQLELPPGNYIFFTKEDNAFRGFKPPWFFYTTVRDVRPQAVTRVPIDLTYKSYE
jgi:hypothetical protein